MRKVIVFSGAGISAESGISTFRDSDGLWENNKIEEICNINTWKKNREKVFDFYNQRRKQLKDVEPNLIHKTLKELEEHIKVIHLTQNVDDLLERAGCSNIIHLHGELTKMMCTSCKIEDENGKEHPVWEVNYEEVKEDEVRCPHCNSNKGVKPFVVFFYEQAPNYYKMKKVFGDINDGDFILVLGTMGNVINISSHIDYLSNNYNIHTILNNLEKSPSIKESSFSILFYKKGTEAIKEIKDYILNRI